MKKYIILVILVIAAVAFVLLKEDKARVDVLGVSLAHPKDFVVSRLSEINSGRADVDFSNDDSVTISNVPHSFIYSNGTDKRLFKDGELGIEVSVKKHSKSVTLADITPRYSEAFDKPLVVTAAKVGRYDANLVEGRYYIVNGNTSVIIEVSPTKVSPELEKAKEKILASLSIKS